ncbi:hypothetical protein NQ314_012979 [Rhamnusium bicolor]|uniref:Uncharacterized protein n=1 Tax=Rhamnusium bicolor TaxID=1586634 RepID=A0AAV8XAZ6_9CUCU|nr:hypothetical protein NQ314_012979 [Rhamnusium bicolor]
MFRNQDLNRIDWKGGYQRDPNIYCTLHHSSIQALPALTHRIAKGRPYSYPIPPYAVQMEPLIQYSQRDPLYDTNIFSLNADSHNDLGRDDLLTENNHIQENIHQENHVYGPHKPHIIERPVYIKEPEPIIEIIIKESNVSLPAPPTVPPPKKKKEQVQVFYVKYKKNPHGVGKDSVIYDKPVPAISPKLPEDEDEEEEEEESSYNYHQQSATAPPPPSTTLRTIIKPDSEVYHSPSGIKVTFGKEGFDYDKRSSKPEEYNPSQPQGRQLSSFSNTYFKRPSTNQNYQSPLPNFRAPQPYRPFSFPPPPPSNYKPVGRQNPSQFSSQPKYPFQSPPYTKPTSQQYSNFPPSRPQSPPSPQFSHSISHPPPPSHFHNPRPSPPQTRQPVAYKPFDNLRPQQSFPQLPLEHNQPSPHINSDPPPQIQFRPETHFPTHQQLPLAQQSHTFNPPRYSQQNPQTNVQQQFRKEESPRTRTQHVQSSQPPQQSRQPLHTQQPLQTQQSLPPQQALQIHQPQQSQPTHYQHQINHNDFRNQQIIQNQQQTDQQELISQNEHLNNIQTAQHILPPGGQLIQSVPKYEQHISEIQPVDGHKVEQGFYTTPRSGYQSTRRTAQYISSTPRISYQTSTAKSTTTTEEPEKPSTTTKDPKILEAQLPDEVPDELREQLLSSGILNNADISILDYDKVGDIPLAPVPSILQRDGSAVEERITETEEEDQEPEASEIEEVKAVSPPGVEMKVVHYNPETEKGQKIQESYVEEGAQQVEPVVLNDNTYNRYLPLKVNGTQFPIPDVPELKGKKISSVVVLAPVTYDFSSGRKARETRKQPSDIDLIQGDALKQLLNSPTLENYKQFLESENKTRSDKQAVILLVTDPKDSSSKEKEIYMYDVATQTVSKLSGELSSAFVEAAEANSEDNPEEGTRSAASNIVPIIDPMQEEDMETDASEQLESFVDTSGLRVSSQGDLTVSDGELNSLENQILINSGYSKTGHS